MLKITIGITGIRENLRRDKGIEQPYWGPSHFRVGKLFLSREKDRNTI